jgi:hypothetical protein
LYNTENPDEKLRAVGEIDTDRVFFAYVESYDQETQKWDFDDTYLQFQRDSVSVLNLEWDPDFLLFMALTWGLLKRENNLPIEYSAELGWLVRRRKYELDEQIKTL